MSHHTKDKGDLAVAKVIAHLLEHDIRVCLPLSEHLPFDFIAVMPDMKTLKRVQVKYRTMQGGMVQVNFRSNYYDTKKIYSLRVNLDFLDCYAVYCPDNNECYYLRIDEIPANALAVNLRILPTRSGQQQGVRYASQFFDPFRMVSNDECSCTPSARSPRRCNELQRAHLIEQLMMEGFYVCIPHSYHIPFDLVAVTPDMQTLHPICIDEHTNWQNFRVDLHINPARMYISGPVTQR
ncbi:MAG: group I intron-associated PD-(D/E)XK endonuclease [Chloroflexota bacterium]|nr:group I intron-associated PD-(D/E)XK endonuclease [Chloroflexota bacterium]